MWFQFEEALESFLLCPAKLALRACVQAPNRLAAVQRPFWRRLSRDFFRYDYINFPGRVRDAIFLSAPLSGAARIGSQSIYAARPNPDWPFAACGIPVRLRGAGRPARTTTPAADVTNRNRASRGLSRRLRLDRGF